MSIQEFFTKVFLIPIFIFAFLTFAPLLFAHGEEQVIEKRTDKYTIQIVYDPFETEIGESVTLRFQLLDADKKEDITFDDAFINISKDSKTLFAGTVGQSEFGGMRISYAFPQEGKYTILVRFQTNKKNESGSSTIKDTLAEASLPFEIQKSEFQKEEEAKQTANEKNKTTIISVGIFFAGLLIGSISSFAVYKKKNH